MRFVIAEISTHSTAYVTGQYLFVAGMMVGIMHCWRLSRQPGVNPSALLSLSFLLSGWLLASLMGLLKDRLAGQQVVQTLAGLAFLALIFAAIILAVIGMLECRRERERYPQGRAQAAWALGLSAILLPFFVTGTVRGFMAKREVMTARSVVPLDEQPVAGALLVRQDLNFWIGTPGPPWVQLDAARLNPSAKLAFRRSRPEVYCLIIAEPVGYVEFDNDQLTEAVESRLRGVSTEMTVLGRVSASVGPLQFRRLEIDAELKSGGRFSYAYWLCATNGWAYQLNFWGRQDDRAAVGEEAAKLVKLFGLVELERRAPERTASP